MLISSASFQVNIYECAGNATTTPPTARDITTAPPAADGRDDAKREGGRGRDDDAQRKGVQGRNDDQPEGVRGRDDAQPTVPEGVGGHDETQPEVVGVVGPDDARGPPNTHADLVAKSEARRVRAWTRDNADLDPDLHHHVRYIADTASLSPHAANLSMLDGMFGKADVM